MCVEEKMRRVEGRRENLNWELISFFGIIMFAKCDIMQVDGRSMELWSARKKSEAVFSNKFCVKNIKLEIICDPSYYSEKLLQPQIDRLAAALQKHHLFSHNVCASVVSHIISADECFGFDFKEKSREDFPSINSMVFAGLLDAAKIVDHNFLINLSIITRSKWHQ